MTKHIRTNFSSPEEAQKAKEYLTSSGFESTWVDQSTLTVETEEEDWISAYEITNSMGGQLADSSGDEVDQHYFIASEGDGMEEEIAMVDQDSYIDPNFGYGDYELLEPYTLHTYEKIVEEQEASRTEST